MTSHEIPAGKILLHFSPRSPYVRKVMIAAHEMGLADRLHSVRTVVGGTTPHRELMRVNPLGKTRPWSWPMARSSMTARWSANIWTRCMPARSCSPPGPTG